jgi:hypothetical protein
MPEQHFDAVEMDHAEEVLDVVLVPSDEAAEPMQPGK